MVNPAKYNMALLLLLLLGPLRATSLTGQTTPSSAPSPSPTHCCNDLTAVGTAICSPDGGGFFTVVFTITNNCPVPMTIMVNIRHLTAETEAGPYYMSNWLSFPDLNLASGVPITITGTSHQHPPDTPGTSSS